MSNMNGLEAMKIIQKKCALIITLAANSMKGDREKFISLGMDAYLFKLIDEDELYRTLVEFL